VLLQKQKQRQAEAALGKAACAVMACRAAVGKQLGRRFSLIEILSVCRTAGQRSNCTKDE
jgi:hypothetical protein